MKRQPSVWLASLAVLLSLYASNASAALYASTADFTLDTIDPATGNATVIGLIGGASDAQRMDGIAFSPSGALFGVQNLAAPQLWSINASTAAASPVGSLGLALNPGDAAVALEFSPGGTLYTATTGGQLYTVNTTTGAATLVGNIGLPAAGDLASAPDGNLYMSSGAGGSDPNSLIQVDPTTGVGTLVGPIGFNDVFGLDFIGNTLYGLDDSGALITIDPTTGAGTLAANTSPTVIGLDLAVSPSPVPVPEPSALLLLSAGVGLVSLKARARSNRPVGRAR
jgi:hypothetical protein